MVFNKTKKNIIILTIKGIHNPTQLQSIQPCFKIMIGIIESGDYEISTFRQTEGVKLKSKPILFPFHFSLFYCESL